MANLETRLTLDDAVHEVLAQLTGLDLQYQPEQDRYRVIASFLNMAMRRTALDYEWSYYSSLENAGTATEGQQYVDLRTTVRMRIIQDDAVRLEQDGVPVRWAFIVPRDSLHAKTGREGLWCSITRNTIKFSRPFTSAEEGMSIMVPVMREPVMFRLPDQPEDPNLPLVEVPQAIRDQLVDFDFPDLVVARALYMYAQADPVVQPRVQTLEQDYKTLMYQLIERDEKHTDAADQNSWTVPIANDIYGGTGRGRARPFADERWR